MTDAEYVFNQTSRERKQLANAARHKKNGSRSRKCTLPGDYLSKKEKLALNGEVKTYSMKKRYTVEEFKQMPDDIQLEYVNHKINCYDLGSAVISKELFGMSGSWLKMYFHNKGLGGFMNKASHLSADKRSKAIRKMLREVVFEEESGEDAVVEEASPPVADLPVVTSENCLVPQITETKVVNATFDMVGFDMTIIQMIAGMFAGEDVSVRVQINKRCDNGV